MNSLMRESSWAGPVAARRCPQATHPPVGLIRSKPGDPLALRAAMLRATRPAAFTLVELMVVIAILGILMSLVAGGAMMARRKGAITNAKSMIAVLETVITMYQSDMGEYPASGNANLVAAMQDDPGDAHWEGPYHEFKQAELKDGEVIDPWGQPYIYISVNGGAPEHRTKSYDLFSVGPNGQDEGGSGDDLVNW